MVRFQHVALASSLFASSFAVFNLFPAVNQLRLAKAYNVTLPCLNALNTTLQCDQDLLTMAATVDNFYWEQDNITALCTDECQDAAYEWYNTVQGNCTGQTMVVYGKSVKVNDIAGRYYDGQGVACLQNSNLDYCMIQSLQWTGYDIIRPDCTATPNDPACSDPNSLNPDNQRMANLYPNSTLCSDCFVQMMYTRLSSPYLANTNHSDYLIGQYQDIVDVCSTAAPSLIIRPSSYYTSGPFAGPTATPTPAPGNSTGCTGRVLPQSSDGGVGCDSLSVKYNVTTGDLQYATNSTTCAFSTAPCVPAACQLARVTTAGTQSCDQLAASYSTQKMNVTTIQFLNWNQNIIGLCDGVDAQYVCSGAPNGTYILPAATTNNTDANGQNRFGSGAVDGQGPANPGVTTTPANPTATRSADPNAPSPTQTGIVSTCNKYNKALSGDYCEAFAKNNNITAPNLYTWNTILGPQGQNCSTLFQANVYYCIGVKPPTATPTPVQSGIAANCNNYKIAQKGDYCSKFAPDNGITTAQLYAWNPVLGSNGENCNTQFQAGENYCIGVAGSATTTPAPTPSPVQSGIASNCNRFKQAISGDYCSKFAPDNGITTAQLYKWNPVLGSNGENCSTQFQAGENYCVGVSS